MNTMVEIFARVVRFSDKNKNIVILFTCFFIGIFYIRSALFINPNIFTATGVNYYSYLLDAFMHGRVDVNLPNAYDLSVYQNKWYLYWGPAPVLFVFPFYLFSHVQASDRLYTLVGGIGNIILFYFILEQLQRHFKIQLSLMATLFLLLSFSLASPNFFLSLNGSIWFTSQIFATTYLLLFYFCYFLFLNKNKHYFFILATTFFYLAVLSRYSLIFSGILFYYLFFHYHWHVPFKIFRSFILLTLIFAGIFFTYNYLRFGNILEVGQRYQQGAYRFDAILKHNQILSVAYLWHNVYYYFLNVIHFQPTNRPVIIDTEGNSVFSVYPALLLLPTLFYKLKYLHKERLYFVSVGSVIAIISTFFLMIYFATGTSQFGNRYFFDVIPILFFMLIFIVNYIPNLVQLTILLFGIYVNIYGSLAFFGK